MMQELAIRAEAVQVRCEYENYQVVTYETESGEEITAVGALLCTEGECILHGTYIQHKKYGRQFQVSYFEEILPTKPEAIKRYLIRAGIAEVGQVLAERIVEKFGKQTFEALEDPVKLATVKDISEEKAKTIVASFKKRQELYGYSELLADYGIPASKTQMVFQTFAGVTDALAVLKKRPYLLCLCKEISFPMVDTAKKRHSDFCPELSDRIRFGLLFCIRKNEEKGHVFIQVQALLQSTQEVLYVPGTDKAKLGRHITDVLWHLVREKSLVYDYGVIYRRQMYDAECQTADKLLEMSQAEQETRKSRRQIEDVLIDIQKKEGIQLCSGQLQAVLQALTLPVSIITGGPGCGKTRLLGILLLAQETLYPESTVALCAPTGRAARKMAESTGCDAVTVHHLLDLHQEGEVSDDAVVETDLLVVDECSMMSMQLMHALLNALRAGTRLVLIGDCDQLPSVQAGNVFSDLIGCHAFPVTCLTETFRQTQGSSIIANAKGINQGNPRFVWDADCRLYQSWQESDTLEGVLATVKTLHAEGISFERMQVLTPFRNKTQLGVVTLNAKLQEVMNPKSVNKGELFIGKQIFREGDRVMHLENETEVSNGDLGVILAVNISNREITVEFENGRKRIYTQEELRKLEHAFALTVHKSQGGEYDCVILPFVQLFGRLRQKNLLYTAMTRAKKKLVIVGNEETLSYAAKNRGEQRNTYLGFRIMDGIRMKKKCS